MIDKSLLRDAVICKENNSILEATKIMRDTQTRHLIVVDKSLFPKGIISAFDITNRVIAEEKDASSVFVSDIMTSPVETIELNDDYETASEKMVANEFVRIPITNKGKLVGILDFSSVFQKVCEVKK